MLVWGIVNVDICWALLMFVAQLERGPQGSEGEVSQDREAGAREIAVLRVESPILFTDIGCVLCCALQRTSHPYFPSQNQGVASAPRAWVRCDCPLVFLGQFLHWVLKATLGTNKRSMKGYIWAQQSPTGGSAC